MNDRLIFDREQAAAVLVYGYQSDGDHVIPPHYQPASFKGDTILWLLPAEADSGSSKLITCVSYRVRRGVKGLTISFDGDHKVQELPARPACDLFGNKIVLQMEGGELLQNTFARFYWDDQLKQSAERTFMRRKKDIREGYVLSTLNKKAYAGTYPAVDHEFHMKGRFAVGGRAEASLIKRMLELQLKIMREDKKGLSRNVCAVQPNRSREYDVWRDSRDHRCRAQMFRITANIEFIEALYNYYSLTKDRDFVISNISSVEKSCAYIIGFIGDDGLLDSHVYYEDQVMKDGAVLQAQLFAVNGFRLMSKLEGLFSRTVQAAHYSELSDKLAVAAVRDFPAGFWDRDKGRFIDWIDPAGRPHDHIHLLANELPGLFGVCSEEQARSCAETIAAHSDVFDRFPSFVAAQLADYTDTEIGTGGPYDLCAAGRYWCWDAEYLSFRGDGEKLRRQLEQVARQAQADGYLMGERYDMNYVYYNTGDDARRNWHGASDYYEYPNVYQYVLICEYLGVKRGFDCDIELKPLFDSGTVTLEQYGIRFTVRDKKVDRIENISAGGLTVRYCGKIFEIAAGGCENIVFAETE